MNKDQATVRVTSVTSGARTLTADPPLLLTVEQDDGLLIIDDDELNLLCYSDTYDGLVDEVAVSLFMLWDGYAMWAPEEMTDGSQELRLTLLARLREGTV